MSVIAAFKEAGVHGRLRLLAESESVFNDGTAAVAFTIALALVMGGEVTASGVIGTLVLSVVGGLVCGAVVGGAVLLLAGRSEDHLVDTLAAYGSFLAAEHFHLSGVLASLAAGLIISNVGVQRGFTEKGQSADESFWEYVVFVVNSLIFLLIGIRVAHQTFEGLLVPVTVAIGLVLIGRALAIYPLSALFHRPRLRVSFRHQHVLFWGGLRGALALALALGLPPEILERETIVTVAFGVVAFSVFAQGLTITPLLRRLGELPQRG